MHEGEAWAESVDELVTAALAAEGRTVDDLSRIDDAVARGVLASEDGRVFLERQEVVDARRASLTGKESQSSFDPSNPLPEIPPGKGEEAEVIPEELGPPDDPKLAGSGAGTNPAMSGSGPRGLTAAPRAIGDNIEGSDSRVYIMSPADQTPWRQVGVKLALTTNTAQPPLNEYAGGGWGSGTMVGPRHVLSARHVVRRLQDESVNGGFALPGARGSGYTGNAALYDSADVPFGNRMVYWYYWPANNHAEVCTNANIRYDYGILILENINWSPGYISFGYKPAIDLDWMEANMVGYPWYTKSCSAFATGTCSGYMYYEHGNITSVYTNTLYHHFDVQEGQSGASIYLLDNGNSTTYALHTVSSHGIGCGLKFREGSFNTICSWIGNFPSSYFPNPSC